MSSLDRNNLYFWKNTAVLVAEENIPNVTAGLLCVDAWFDDQSDPENRYGKFMEPGGWKHVPLEDFSSEFRMHLLLLGVS